jgi:hypothetical protein
LSFVTENQITEDVSEDLLSISSSSTTFIVATEKNLKNMFHQNEEKYARIRELEEQLRHAKKNEGGLKEFKSCVEKAMTYLEETAIDMYAHIHVFQQLAAEIMDQHSRVQTKNI